MGTAGTNLVPLAHSVRTELSNFEHSYVFIRRFTPSSIAAIPREE